VVITDLTHYGLPFLRDRIGDLAEAIDPREPCPCGRGLPRLGRIEGRVQSILIGANGSYVPGTFFAHVLKDYDHAVRQFQIVQEKRGEIVFRVVKGKRYSDDTLAEVLRVLRQYLGADLGVHVEFCENIEMVRTGKRLATVSKLGIDFQQIKAS
jgi:phenylacetate-CoA ligase